MGAEEEKKGRVKGDTGCRNEDKNTMGISKGIKKGEKKSDVRRLKE